MSTIYEFSKQVKVLCKAKNFTQALEYFKANKANFDKAAIAGNNYLIADHCCPVKPELIFSVT